jgi:glycine betaine/proline transport system permease protein
MMDNAVPYHIPIGEWVSHGIDGLQEQFADTFDTIADLLTFLIQSLEQSLLSIPPWLMALIFVALAIWRVGWRFGLFTFSAMLLLIGMELWQPTMVTLALVLAASLMALCFGIPLGIAMARWQTVRLIVIPVLDFMQTMPPFVYLIPAAIFFGLGQVPGAIATFIFSLPPAARLTDLGIRQVDRECLEAGRAFGCTPFQLLVKIQLPLALPSIMAGINQTMMLALSMVVIAAMIGAGGLGNTVLTGIQRLDIGLGFEGGLAVVLLAIVLDRLTQSVSNRQTPSLWERMKQVGFKKS